MVSVSFEKSDFKQHDKVLVQSVEFKVRRNYSNFPIGPGVTKESRKKVMDMVDDLCRTYVGNTEGKFYKLDGIKDEDKEKINWLGIEKNEKETFLSACGINDDWPEHRAVFVNANKTFWIKVNFLDHIEISLTTGDTGFMESLE